MTSTVSSSLPPATSLRPRERSTETSVSAETDAPQLPLYDIGLEGLIFAAFLIVIFVYRFLKPKPSNPEVKTDKAPNRLSLDEPGKPERFEAATARPLVQKSCIEGRAYVTDGDTIVIEKTQIRLFGIDAAELNHPYGQKAKWAMVELCKGQTVRAEITEMDAYGRTVAKCYLKDGRDLSAEMVKQGLAIDWKKFSGGEYRCLEKPDARRKLWLADARQNGRKFLWEQYEYEQTHALRQRSSNDV